MDGQANEVRWQRRVVVAVFVIASLAALAACTSLAAAATSPSPTGTPAAADTGGGSFQVTWVLVAVVAFVGAGWVVWLKRRGGGREDHG